MVLKACVFAFIVFHASIGLVWCLEDACHSASIAERPSHMLLQRRQSQRSQRDPSLVPKVSSDDISLGGEDYSGECPDFKNQMRVVGKEMAGSQNGTESFADCCESCSSTSGCAGWTFYKTYDNRALCTLVSKVERWEVCPTDQPVARGSPYTDRRLRASERKPIECIGGQHEDRGLPDGYQYALIHVGICVVPLFCLLFLCGNLFQPWLIGYIIGWFIKSGVVFFLIYLATLAKHKVSEEQCKGHNLKDDAQRYYLCLATGPEFASSFVNLSIGAFTLCLCLLEVSVNWYVMSGSEVFNLYLLKPKNVYQDLTAPIAKAFVTFVAQTTLVAFYLASTTLQSIVKTFVFEEAGVRLADPMRTFLYAGVSLIMMLSMKQQMGGSFIGSLPFWRSVLKADSIKKTSKRIGEGGVVEGAQGEAGPKPPPPSTCVQRIVYSIMDTETEVEIEEQHFRQSEETWWNSNVDWRLRVRFFMDFWSNSLYFGMLMATFPLFLCNQEDLLDVVKDVLSVAFVTSLDEGDAIVDENVRFKLEYKKEEHPSRWALLFMAFAVIIGIGVGLHASHGYGF